MISDDLKTIRALADKPLKTASEMKMVELVVLLYNEHEMAADMIGRLVKYANYPFKLTVLNNTAQNVPINFSRQWNKIIRESECDFICFMDSDVFFEQDWLKRMMESFDDPEVQFVVPVLDKTSCKQAYATEALPYPSSSVLTEMVAAQCVLYRKSVFEKIGLFDERFLLYGQDSEWGHRFLKRKMKAIVRTDTWAHHIGSFSIGKFNDENRDGYSPSVEREYARNLFKFLTK